MIDACPLALYVRHRRGNARAPQVYPDEHGLRARLAEAREAERRLLAAYHELEARMRRAGRASR